MFNANATAADGWLYLAALRMGRGASGVPCRSIVSKMDTIAVCRLATCALSASERYTDGWRSRTRWQVRRRRLGAAMGRNRIKTVRAGRLVCAVCYSQAIGSDTPAVRQAKSRVSSAARQRLNFRAAWQKLELLLAANFEPSDCFVTLTYDDAHLPPCRSEALGYFKKYAARLRAAYRRAGHELRYVYTTETMPDAPDGQGRLHHHMVVTRIEAETLRSLWGGGSVHIEPLLDGATDSYEARARYLVKERHPGALGRRVGLRAWSGSRNLRKPEETSELVADSVTITAPPGAFVLDRRDEGNCYGSYTYIKYLLPLRQRE